MEANIVEVSAGLIFREGKLLIAQRHHNAHLGGLWEFPGGKRRSDESFEQCLRRELEEELGIVVEVQDLLETVTHEYPEKTVHLKFFRCAWLCNEPQKLGCRDFAWINFDQLADYAFPAADTRLLEKLSASPELWSNP